MGRSNVQIQSVDDWGIEKVETILGWRLHAGILFRVFFVQREAVGWFSLSLFLNRIRLVEGREFLKVTSSYCVKAPMR